MSFGYKIFGFTFLIVVFVDQLSKYIVRSFGNIPYYYNEGVAFSIKILQPWQTILIFCSLLATMLIVYRQARLMGNVILYIAGGLIFGGALGNFIDRVMHSGKVIDFIHMPYFSVFNIADVCITLGVLVFLYYSLLQSGKTSEG